MELKRIHLKLKDLYLDPNNYRFIESEEYVKVIDDDSISKSVQNRTMKLLKQKGIDDILESLKDNGFLEVDNIQVRELENHKGKYIVVEGNRRVASLKILELEYLTGSEKLGKLDPKIFSKLPVYRTITEEKQKHLIIMGLKHISGNKKWDPANQAKLMYDYLSEYVGKDNYLEEESKLAKSLAINSSKIRSYLNTFYLIELYKESIYGGNFKNKMFSIFVEAIKKPNVSEWLEWDKEKCSPKNIKKIERFFSWISPIDEEIDEEFIDYYDEENEAIITKGVQIRDLDLFINDQTSIDIMEKFRSIEEGMKNFRSKEKLNIGHLINTLQNDIKYIAKYEELLGIDDLKKVFEAKKILDNSFKAPILNNEIIERTNIYPIRVKQHFTELNIINYKALENFKLSKLNRINILTGENNSGKTSLLEAIYMLLNQNDIVKYFNLVKQRHKVTEMNTLYLNEVSLNNFLIEGRFNEEFVSVKMNKYEDENIDKKDDYIVSYQLEAKVETEDYLTKTHTYINSGIKSNYIKIMNLCNNTYQSPYVYSQEIIDHYSKMKLQKYKGVDAEEVFLNFLRKVDSSITELFLIERNNTQRLMIRSSKRESLDFRKYGEGVQRICELILSFMANKTGVILIDELEVGIHYSLLVELTKFIQELAEEFNVQVFITTHSEECLKAFVENDYKNDMLAFHQLIKEDGKISSKYIGGERYKYLSNAIKLEIRGGKK